MGTRGSAVKMRRLIDPAARWSTRARARERRQRPVRHIVELRETAAAVASRRGALPGPRGTGPTDRGRLRCWVLPARRRGVGFHLEGAVPRSPPASLPLHGALHPLLELPLGFGLEDEACSFPSTLLTSLRFSFPFLSSPPARAISPHVLSSSLSVEIFLVLSELRQKFKPHFSFRRA
ncbi:hypothetical protein PUN28_001670 [Cardiocondyla obscurior]|uniref:Uncharacterized protein n=1 Tax=Cardiocondyla obscurior TaxID=286306 RepID=A0AAW2GQQ8_9HYME